MKTIQSLIAAMYFGTQFDRTSLRFEASDNCITFKWGSDYLLITEETGQASHFGIDANKESDKAYSLIDGMKMIGGNEVRDLFRYLPNILERSLPTLFIVDSVATDEYDEFTLIGKDTAFLDHKLTLRLSSSLNIQGGMKASDVKEWFYEDARKEFGVGEYDVLSGIFIDFINGLDRSVFTDYTNIVKSKDVGSTTYSCNSVYGNTTIKVTLGQWETGIGLSIEALKRHILPNYLFSLCQSLDFVCGSTERIKVIFRIDERDTNSSCLVINLRDIGTVEISIA